MHNIPKKTNKIVFLFRLHNSFSIDIWKLLLLVVIVAVQQLQDTLDDDNRMFPSVRSWKWGEENWDFRVCSELLAAGKIEEGGGGGGIGQASVVSESLKWKDRRVLGKQELVKMKGEAGMDLKKKKKNSRRIF